ncbi:restriction endonuclease subunit S [Rhizobium johnstonii]|uniref:restriction endonuclease subunit S n=1 Tax=Rhizobium johnstonii TaxID=3019933 RepID=UPI003F9BEFF0
MIDGLRPYAEMKLSGLPWLDEVPAHWDVRRIKTLLSEVDNRTKTGKERLLSLRMRQGLVDHLEVGGTPIQAESLVNFKIVEPGQVVMNRMRAAAGLFGVANLRGLVSPDYAVFEPKPQAFNPYLLQAFRLPSLSAVFRTESKGLGTGESGFLRLYTDRFGPIPVPYPPLEEQRLIVRFLDWHGAQTEKLIRAKKKIIALLNEQKQAIIHHAVTRGLDPNVRLKPSGISWLGDVPEHWTIQSLGSMIKRRSERNRTDLPLLSVVRERGVILRSSMSDEENHNFVPDDLSNYKVALRGDLVINKMKAWQGSLGIAPCDGIVSPAYFVFQLDIEDIAFGQMLLRSKPYVACFARVSDGVRIGQWDLSIDGMKRIPVLRPSCDEQAAIVEFVDRSMLELERIKEMTLREIALIQEFRTRLVGDVVTGKLDVQALAAILPEVAEPEPIDDLAEEDDLDEALDDAESEEVAA